MEFIKLLDLINPINTGFLYWNK